MRLVEHNGDAAVVQYADQRRSRRMAVPDAHLRAARRGRGSDRPTDIGGGKLRRERLCGAADDESISLGLQAQDITRLFGAGPKAFALADRI